MSALAILLILVIALIFILLIGISNKISGQKESLRDLKNSLDILAGEIQQLREKEKTGDSPAKIISKEIARDIPVIPPVKPLQEEPLPAILEEFSLNDEDERQYAEVKDKKKVSSKKNTDLERFIGENLANKIGIAVLVLGISFFVKYAIDNNWVNETGRVIIGLISGGILIGLAHYIRNNYRSFSSVLVGGGLTVFYFTIAYAFHEYQLVSQQTAFIIMVLISAFAVLLSLYYNKQELAVLATIGGFVTPFLVTTGQENYIALFSYLCILNAGLMVLSWFKRWPAINIIALCFTTLTYGGWLIKRTVFEEAENLPYQDAFLFASLFYVLFVVMNIVNNLRVKRQFGAFDFIVVLSVNFLYYAAAFFILTYYNGNYKGLFTASLGVINLLLAIIFYRKKNVDNNFVSLLMGLALAFISLTAPVQLKGNHIVLFWASEAVVLFWLYQRTRIIHLKIASFIVAVLMTGSLLMNWSVVYFHDFTILPLLLNRGFVTGLVAALALFIYYLMLQRQKEEFYFKGIRGKYFLPVSLVIAYFTGLLEIYYQFSTRFPATMVYAVYTQLYSFTIALVLLQVFRRTPDFRYLKLILTALCLGIYLFHLFINYNISVDLVGKDLAYLFNGHWIAAILLLWLLYSLAKFIFKENTEFRQGFTWICTISIILLLSIELYHVILWTSHGHENGWAWWENLYYKAGLSILWGICSLVLMWLGMKYSFRTFRIISLSLFTLTLVKLFGYDIRNIPPGGKIAAFILLGILLLIVSFMYQRLKKIIIDNTSV